ncbi:hypothetical protein JCM17961_17560 [Endothiovibrio diazotrophicus]
MVTQEAVGDRRFGLGKSIAALAEGLTRQGCEVDYVTREVLEARDRRRIDRLRALVARRFGAPLGSLAEVVAVAMAVGRRAAQRARREGYTHLHCHNAFIALGAWLAVAGRRQAPRWGVTMHSFRCTAEAVHRHVVPLGRFAHWLFRVVERRVLGRAAWVVTPTESGGRRIAEDLGFTAPPPRWRAIPHPLPRINLYDREEARRRLGWDADWRVVLGVGMLVPMKGFERLIDALARFSHQSSSAVGEKGERAQLSADRPLQLVLVGEGDREPLERCAREAGLARPPLFALTDDIGLYLAAADLYVSPSTTESFGLANVEAVLAGTPTICTAVDAVPEVIGGAARLVPLAERELWYALRAFLDAPSPHAFPPHPERLLGGHWPSDDQIVARYLEVYSRP